MKINEFKVEFVHRIPDNIKDGILYVCLECDSIIHKCACGCGEIVSTPTSENGWTITYNDSKVTLRPSIGNWNYKCHSHYYIINNRVIWLNKEIGTYNKKQKQKKWWKFFLK